MKQNTAKFLTSGVALMLAASSLCGCFGGTPEDPGKVPGGEDGEEVYEYYDYTAAHTSTNRNITFVSTDTQLDGVLNDYRERHMRDTENRVHSHPVGAGSSPWKEWESMIGSWWDASNANGTMSAAYATKDLVTNWLETAKIDEQGYVWTDDGGTLASWAFGWEFPNYKNGGKAWGYSADPNYPADPWEGWSVTGGAASNKNNRYTVTLSGAKQAEIVSPEFEVGTKVAPFLRMNIAYLPVGGSDIDDLYVYYQTAKTPGWSEDRKVAFSTFCTTGYPIGTQGIANAGYGFPMYLAKDYTWSTDIDEDKLTRVKLVLKAKETSTVNGEWSFGFLSTDFDDRQTNNVCNYIIAAAEILGYSQNSALLQTVMPKARKAMNFLLHQLGGESGLISTEYFMGHGNDRRRVQGTQLGNGYWDVLAFPNLNLYANLEYYYALKSMAFLENMSAYYKLNLPETTTRDASLKSNIAYKQTEQSIDALAERCKTRIQTEFWNEKTGRFHAGFIDGMEREQDHGYLFFNQQAIALGIPTEEQKQSIMEWVNGEREVCGDNSQGEDIFRYEFASRFNTQNIAPDFYSGYSSQWDGNVQNGGTALQLAYYDIVAQKSIGRENAYGRLTAIKQWYLKVQEAFEKADLPDFVVETDANGNQTKIPKSWKFYRPYYNTLPDVTPQGGNTSGMVGLDYEFLEAALLFKAVPDAFFGLSAGRNGTLQIAPALPKELKFWRMENLTFAGRYYDLSIGRYFAQISGVEDYRSGSAVADAKVQFTFEKPSFEFEFYLDGQKSDDYAIENNRIVVSVPFRATKAEIKAKAV